MMEEMFRWMLIIGLLAGMRVSMEEEPYLGIKSVTSNRGGETRPFCCNTQFVKTCVMICRFNEAQQLGVTPDQLYCVNPLDEQPSHTSDGLDARRSVNLQPPYICKLSGAEMTGDTSLREARPRYFSETQNFCIVLDSQNPFPAGEATHAGKSWSCKCSKSCCTVCGKGITGEPLSPSSSPIRPTHYAPDSDFGIQTTTIASTSTFKSTAKLTHILLILLVLLVVAFIFVAVIVIIRKRKFSGRSELSMTRTNQSEAVSSGYEPTVRENHYEPSAEGVPIYTELQLTQEPVPSNNTVYSSVQPTGEAVDMGRPVVYAELDNIAVVFSPVYSQPFESEASGSNTEYAEPFKPDDKSTATAPVPNLYDNVAAVDQQSDVYSLAKAIPLSDPNVIYSQPNKPAK